MANTKAATADNKISTATSDNTPEQEQPAPAPVPTKTGPAQMTFPQIMGHIFETVIANRTLMPQAKHDLAMWYNAQDLETRKEIAKKTKAEFEYARGILESSYHHFMAVAFQDLQ